MTIQDEIVNEYFEWICKLVCGTDKSRFLSYEKLLTHLHSVKFTYTIRKDQNRAEDGKDLRWRFICGQDYPETYNDYLSCLDEPCSVLEMIIAIAIRCEDLMDDPSYGNRTAQWFWGMIVNLGIGSMTDARYDRRLVDVAISKFLKREYEPDGKGGLFTVRNCEYDLRSVEIWKQMCLYLDTFI
jgi:hypothetical protein